MRHFLPGSLLVLESWIRRLDNVQCNTVRTDVLICQVSCLTIGDNERRRMAGLLLAFVGLNIFQYSPYRTYGLEMFF